MITIKPDAIVDNVAYAACLNEEGDPIGVAYVRISATVPGYVTVVADKKLGHAIRVPISWLTELGKGVS